MTDSGTKKEINHSLGNNTNNIMLNSIKGGVSPLRQTKSTESAHGQLNDADIEFQEDKERTYWYKINGKKLILKDGVTPKAQYIAYQNKPGNMEGGGKTTNHPDVYGRKKGGTVSKPK